MEKMILIYPYSEHLGRFLFWLLQTKLQRTVTSWTQHVSGVTWLRSGKAGLDHGVGVCLTLKGTAQMSPRALDRFTSPPASCSSSAPTLGMFTVFNCSQCNERGGILLSISFIFPWYKLCWASLHVLARHSGTFFWKHPNLGPSFSLGCL